MAKGETMTKVKADIYYDVERLIMGGGDSMEVAYEIVKLVREFDKENN